MKKIILPVLVFVTVGTLSGARADDLVEKLDLSREQIRQLSEQREVYVRDQEQIQVRLREEEQALKQELGREAPNQESVQQHTRELNRLRNQLLEKKVTAVMEMKKLMTREQLQKLERIQVRDGSGNQNSGQEASQNKDKQGNGKQNGHGNKRGKK